MIMTPTTTAEYYITTKYIREQKGDSRVANDNANVTTCELRLWRPDHKLQKPAQTTWVAQLGNQQDPEQLAPAMLQKITGAVERFTDIII